eukprot:COSAG05_NODE_1672_length_4303_cov_1.823026_3_plen_457_part_00
MVAFAANLKGTSVKPQGAAVAQHRGSILAGHIAAPVASDAFQAVTAQERDLALEQLDSRAARDRAQDVRAKARAETHADARQVYASGPRPLPIALSEDVLPFGPDSSMRRKNRAKANRNSRPVGFLGRTRGLGGVDYSDFDAMMESAARTGDEIASVSGAALRYGAATTVAGVATLRDSVAQRPLPFEVDSRWANSPLPGPPGYRRLVINGASRKSPHRVAPMGEDGVAGNDRQRRKRQQRRNRRVRLNEASTDIEAPPTGGPVGGAEPGWDPTGRVSPLVLKNAMSANIFMTKHNAVAPHMVDSVASKVAQVVRDAEMDVDREIAGVISSAAAGYLPEGMQQQQAKSKHKAEPEFQPEQQPDHLHPPAAQEAMAEAKEASEPTAGTEATATQRRRQRHPASRITTVPIKPGSGDALLATIGSTGACVYNLSCAHQYVGKYQSCMVFNGRLIPHAS